MDIRIMDFKQDGADNSVLTNIETQLEQENDISTPQVSRINQERAESTWVENPFVATPNRANRGPAEVTEQRETEGARP